MARASWVWSGLAEYQAELAAAPASVQAEATGILKSEAYAAAAAIRAAYPTGIDARGRARTGRLARGVKVTDREDGAIVRNSTPYATWFEYGNGGSQAGKVFYPIVLPAQRRALLRIIRALEQNYGAVVVQDAA